MKHFGDDDFGRDDSMAHIALKKDYEFLRDTLVTIAAQSSGIAGSTEKADCMAALAIATLRNCSCVVEGIDNNAPPRLLGKKK